MQIKSSSGYSVELLQPAFSITPERFNAIDMVLAPSKLIGTVIHSKVFIKTYVYQSIIATPTVRVDHRIGCYKKWPRLFEQRPEYFKWNLC